MDVAAEIGRIIDRRVEEDDLHENKKRYSIIQLKKMKDPMYLEMVNMRNVDRKEVKEEI